MPPFPYIGAVNQSNSSNMDNEKKQQLAKAHANLVGALETETKKEKILGWCQQLALSQGFYGRLLRDFAENEEYFNYVVEAFDGRDMLDFVLFIES